jgi:membrane-bound serine protease (ClpP class)
MRSLLGASTLWRSFFVALVAVVALVATMRARADEPAAPTRLLSVDGAIDSVAARYVDREVERANAEGAGLIVIQLDTPGGMESSMREMTQTLLASHVPTVVYVSPAGARAASAGMFVVLAANVAAMAPGTEIGAAHPVRIGSPTDTTMERKVVSDAAALARALAEARHHNPDWAALAVRESASLSADEARRQGVVDLVASDVPDLLRQLDGRSVATASGEHLLRTTSPVDERPMLVTEHALPIVSHPNVAYLLFLLGIFGIIAELYHPGAFLPGTLGLIALVLAFVGFGNLPISWAGVLLVLCAIGLFLGELHTGVGALALGGWVSLVFGSLLLYSPPGPASPARGAVRVSPWLIAFMSGMACLFFLVVLREALRTRRLAVRTGIATLIGHPGVAISELAPSGTVRVDSEVWSAQAIGGAIPPGERVEVVDVAGVTLRVTRAPAAKSSGQPYRGGTS